MWIENREDLLVCRRNELVPENPPVLKTGIEGLLEYRINKNKRHPDCIYQRYDETEEACQCNIALMRSMLWKIWMRYLTAMKM